jgi:2-succinyl-5-enolpyruvyl-6-hydroxy-3-cyclohexene-1-carboxylate synthase
MIRPENRNILWATILVDELARAGVTHTVICPGSRSTPLAVAFSRDERFTIYSIIDERAAAFFALGIGKSSGNPAAVVCTSGTATANFFPAIIEASMSNVPMIVMTADRPHELRDSGANQTIDQVKLYGGYVRWFVDVAPPHANPEDKTLRYLRTTIDRAVAYAKGVNGGPVHLNVPFEKPLEPVVVEGDVPDKIDQKHTVILPARTGLPDVFDIETIRAEMQECPRGLFIVGADASLYDPEWLIERSKEIGYPILAECQSRLRFNKQVDTEVVFGGYDSYLRGEFAQHLNPEIIIQFGNLPVGSTLLNFLNAKDNARRVLISPTGKWLDDTHRVDLLVHARADYALEFIGRDLGTTSQPEWLESFRTAEDLTWQAIKEMPDNEGGVLRDVVDALPDSSMLFIASSNPIRHLDQFVPPQSKQIYTYANRGVSGIDGTVASSLGVATTTDNPAALVLGDLALYHDLNSLHLIRRLNIPLIIVCINNDGGGIFHRLPIAKYDPPFRNLFVTPHGLTFEHAAKMFDIPYTLANMGGDFRAAFKAAIDSGGPHLIEVPSDAAKFEQQRQKLIETVAQRIKEAGIIEKFKASQAVKPTERV